MVAGACRGWLGLYMHLLLVERMSQGRPLQVLLLLWPDLASSELPSVQLPHGTQDVAPGGSGSRAVQGILKMLVQTPHVAGATCVHAQGVGTRARSCPRVLGVQGEVVHVCSQESRGPGVRPGQMMHPCPREGHMCGLSPLHPGSCSHLQHRAFHTRLPGQAGACRSGEGTVGRVSPRAELSGLGDRPGWGLGGHLRSPCIPLPSSST